MASSAFPSRSSSTGADFNIKFVAADDELDIDDILAAAAAKRKTAKDDDGQVAAVKVIGGDGVTKEVDGEGMVGGEAAAKVVGGDGVVKEVGDGVRKGQGVAQEADHIAQEKRIPSAPEKEGQGRHN